MIPGAQHHDSAMLAEARGFGGQAAEGGGERQWSAQMRGLGSLLLYTGLELLAEPGEAAKVTCAPSFVCQHSDASWRCVFAVDVQRAEQ
eukprot:56685-Rhodomonas_salina.1